MDQFKYKATETVTAIEGEPFKLECDAPNGYPKPSSYWVIQLPDQSLQNINNSRISLDPEGTLWFSSIARNDSIPESYYVCAATSAKRLEYKLGAKYSLNITPSANVAQSEPIQQYVTKTNEIGLRGRIVELYCIYGGTPLPKITWSKNGKELEPNDHISFEYAEKKIIIHNVTSDDEGTYSCAVSNGVGGTKEYSFELTVQSAPYFVIEPEIKTAEMRDKVEFQCKAKGNPEPKVKWIHNGVPFTGSINSQIHENNSLIIDGVSLESLGNYGCNASNLHGYVYKDVYLNMNGSPPTIYEHPPPEKSIIGGTATLKCYVIGSPNPYVIWLRNRKKINDERFKIQSNNDLHITDIDESDAGEYQCKAKNRFGTVEASVELEVKRPTRIAGQPQIYNVPKSDSVTMPCDVIGDLEFKVTWSYNDQEINIGNDERISINDDNSLSISNIDENDFGFYTCTVATDLDEDVISHELIVDEIADDDNMLRIFEAPQDYTVMAGAEVTLRCQAHYLDAYDISYNWRIGGSELSSIDDPHYTRNSDNSLTIHRVSILDSEIYTCVVSDGIKEDRAEASLVVQNVPLPPESVKLNCNITSALVTWSTPNENNAPILYYIIKSKNASSDNWTNVSNFVPADKLEYIMKISPNESYAFGVIAHNKVGNSDLSASEPCNPTQKMLQSNVSTTEIFGNPNITSFPEFFLPNIDFRFSDTSDNGNFRKKYNK